MDRIRRLAAVYLIPVVVLTGCVGSGDAPPPKFKVSGTVTLDDEPLVDGDINFDGTAVGLGVDSGKIKDGKYQVLVKSGPKIVRIVATREVPGMENAGIPGTPVYEDIIPGKYNTSSELSADVEAGDNMFDFELSTK